MMRALRFHGIRDLRVEEIAEPELKPRWIKVKNAWAGICGSDLQEFVAGPKTTPTKPHALTGETIPTILGHEFSGTVAEVGEGVTDLSINQKVAVFPIISDGTCHYCQQELYGMCSKWGLIGYSGIGGGLAEYICVPRENVFPVPDTMSLEVAALVEPLAVGWHAVRLADANLDPSSTALIHGAGPIGITVILCLRAIGVGKIVVSEISPTRSQHALEAGADFVIDPLKEDVPDLACQLSGDGLGAHVAFDTTGVQQSVDAAFASVRGRGIVVNLAHFEKPIELQPNSFNRKSTKYVASSLYTRDEFREVIDAIAAGKIQNPERMITARLKLKNAVRDGFQTLLDRRDQHVKILVNAEM